jgi:hypothetical protein
MGLYKPYQQPDRTVNNMNVRQDNTIGYKEECMKKDIAKEVVFKYRFGHVGIGEVKGYLQSVGITEKGKKWVSLLKWHPLKEKLDKVEYKGWILIRESYWYDNIIEGREALDIYFQDLK